MGAGGGGFPAHVKAQAAADIVLGNGAECEPLLRADSELMVRRPERVIRGAALIRDSVGASRAVIAVKAKNERAVSALRSGLGEDQGVEILPLENVYPAGDEYLLVFGATGRAVPEGGIPLDVGVVVNNVTTLAQIADAVEGVPVTERMVTVQGEVARPATFRAPLGTSVDALIERAGGATVDDPAVVMGGPMMGRLARPEGEVTDKTLAGIIVLPGDHRLIGFLSASQAYVLRIARAACCQCLACTELCPRALLGHDLAPHRTVRAIQYGDIDLNHEHITSAFLCCECGMCELFACPLEIQPRRILADLKAELVRRGISNPHRRTELSTVPVREYRQIPTARLVRRLGLSDYDSEAPLDEEPVKPEAVKLRLKQHVGVPAEPVVTVGQEVLQGDLVAEPPAEALGARVHASIPGQIESVTEEAISIRASNRSGGEPDGGRVS